jgi:hypothetical protein
VRQTIWNCGDGYVIFSTLMNHRKTPPVLRHTQPELIPDDERGRRTRRRRLGTAMVFVGAVAAMVALGWIVVEGVEPGAALALSLGLATAATGGWALRASAMGH